jgi:ankyrin repeat protein
LATRKILIIYASILYVEKGADVNKKNHEGEIPLQLAASLGRLTISTHLVEHNADVNEKDNDGGSALNRVILEENDWLCQYLIDLGVDVNQGYTGTAMHLPATPNQVVFLDHLVDIRNTPTLTSLESAIKIR